MASTLENMEAEILAEMSEDPDSFIEPVNDILVIDAESRTINIPNSELLFGVTNDKYVERKYFKCPRIVGDNIDLSTLGLRIYFTNANNEDDVYYVKDMAIEGDYITFSWELSDKLFVVDGAVYFAVVAVKTDSDGYEENAWNTTLATGDVLLGHARIDLTSSEETKTRDILSQLLSMLNTRTDEAIQSVTDEGNAQIANVENAASEQMEKIETAVDDYCKYYWETVVTDKSLTETGKPADAKTVGDKISELSDDIDDLKGDDKLDAGLKVAGTTYTIDGKSVTAGDGAEIFNDYTNNKAAGPYSHAEGYNTTASVMYTHAEGYGTTAKGPYAHAEGQSTTASHQTAHAEGYTTTASGISSHAEGHQTTAGNSTNPGDHAEGHGTKATGGHGSHAEGYSTTASGQASHSEGQSTTASSQAAHAEGMSTTASGMFSHAEGYKSVANNMYNHAEGNTTTASGMASHAEGINTTASGDGSHAEGYQTISKGTHQHVQGRFNVEDSSGTYAHIVGNGTSASARSNIHTLDWSGNAEFAGDVKLNACGGENPISMAGIAASAENSAGLKVEGTAYTIDGSSVTAGVGAEVFNDYTGNKAAGIYSHAEGLGTTAKGMYSHTEGYQTTANGGMPGDHAEGLSTTASGGASHAEGNGTTASGSYSHSEGYQTTASGMASHAEGWGTVASGGSPGSHAEGIGTTASGGLGAHAEGTGTIAATNSQHVQGKYNIEDTANTYAHIVGNGTSDDERSNAHTLDWEGNAWFAGFIEGNAIILPSSTEGSTKKFKLTIDDSGSLNIAEYTTESTTE